jgi:histone-binding protein RBBP4
MSTPAAPAIPEPPAAQQVVADDDDSDAEAMAGADIPMYRDNPKFKTFRKHARDLYQLLATYETVWPAKTVQVMPYVTRDTGSASSLEQTILTGTATAGQEQNYLKLVSLVQPTSSAAELAGCTYDEELRELGAFGMAPASCRFKIHVIMAHNGDVRKARYMPHNPNVIATASSDDTVYVFDRASILRTAPPNSPPRPLLTLLPPKPAHDAPAERKKEYHEKLLKQDQQTTQQETWDSKTHASQHKLRLDAGVRNAWALDWSQEAAGHLAVAGNEGIAVWSLAEVRKTEAGSVVPTHRVETVTYANDVKWSAAVSHTLLVGSGSEGAGGSLTCVDLRSPSAAMAFDPGMGTINSVDWAPYRPGQFAAGGSDGTVRVFDVRNTSTEVASIHAHQSGKEVTVSWCPHDADLVATGSQDTNAAVTNIATGQVLFVHTGHVGTVSDVFWAPHEAFAGQVVTVDDSAISAWKPRNRFWS